MEMLIVLLMTIALLIAAIPGAYLVLTSERTLRGLNALTTYHPFREL